MTPVFRTKLNGKANLAEYAPEGLGGCGYIDNEREILEFARLLLETEGFGGSRLAIANDE